MKIPKIILASLLCVLLLVGCVSSPQEKWDLPTNEDGTVTVYLPVESTMDIYMSIPDPMEPETTKLLYHYTEDGRLSGWETADPSADWGGDQAQRFSYDEYGRLTQLQAFEKSGSAYERRVYEYNEKSQLISENAYFCRDYTQENDQTQEKLTYRNLYFYDDTGRLIRHTEEQFDDEGNMEYSYTRAQYVYAPDESCFEEYSYGWQEGKAQLWEYKVTYYDEAGNKAYCDVYSLEEDGIPGEILYTHTYFYDETGRLAEETTVYKQKVFDGIDGGTKYTYDDHGNMVREYHYLFPQSPSCAAEFQYSIGSVNVTPEAAYRLLKNRPMDPFNLDPTPQPGF